MSNARIPKEVFIDIQAVGMTINENLQRRIFRMIEKFKHYFTKISAAYFYMQQSSKRITLPRTIKVRLGNPGLEIIASGSGKSWKTLMNRVEQKVIEQLKVRKASTSNS